MYTGPVMHYGVIFGKCDASDWIDYDDIVFTPEEEKAYHRCVIMREDPNDCPDLQDALSRAEEDIREYEEDNCVEYDDEYAMECLGYVEMDTEELNNLVHSRDEHALEFFDLEDATDEEIEVWDANDLNDIPNVRDFDPDFVPESPFDSGWILNVEYINPAEEEDLDYDTAGEILYELLEEANGDYSVVREFIGKCEEDYCGEGTLKELAMEMAEEIGLSDFSVEE